MKQKRDADVASKKSLIMKAKMISAMLNMVKIGKTSIDNFEMRIYSLERNGYVNLSGMRRKFAIVVD